MPTRDRHSSDLPADLEHRSRTTITKYPDTRKKSVAVFWVDEMPTLPSGLSNECHGWLKCKSSYNASFVEAMKIAIPGRFRAWIQEEKVWAVAPKYASEFINLAALYYENIRELDHDPRKAAGLVAESVPKPKKREIDSIRQSLEDRSRDTMNVLDQFSDRKVEV